MSSSSLPNTSVTHTEMPFLAMIPSAVALIPATFSGVSTAYGAVTTTYNTVLSANTWYNRFTKAKSTLAQITNFVQGGAHANPAEDSTSLAQDTIAWSLGSYAMLSASKYAYDSFFKQHGPTASTQMTQMVSSGLETARATISTKISNKEFQTKLHNSANAMHRAADDSENTVFTGANNSLFWFTTAMITAFVHSLGAMEMQRRVLRGSLKGDKINIEQTSYWEKINPTQSPKEKTGLFISNVILPLYEKEAFYSTQGAHINYLNVKNIHPVRTMFNILLGAYIQANTFLGLGAKDGRSIIAQFSQWANLVMFWEILAQSLHMYGWAPLYTSLQLIMPLLSNEKQPKQGSVSNATTRGRRQHIKSKLSGKPAR